MDAQDAIFKLVEALMAGDYTYRIEQTDPLAAKLNEFSAFLESKAEDDLARVVSLSVEANETAILSAQLLYNLKQVNDQAQSIAAAGEEMTATVKEIGSYGKSISEQAVQAQDATVSGERASSDVRQQMQAITWAVQETADRVTTLANLSKSISGILDAIKKIASQTNLLALNATIEAARAGEAGKGFAVVAAEVKNLSNQTAGATEQIASIIGNLQSEMDKILESMENSSHAVKSGEAAIENLSQKIHLIRERIDQVSSDTKHISHTLSEQSIASNEVAQGIASIAKSSTDCVVSTERITDAMNAVEKMISAQIALLATMNIPSKVVKLAQSDHVIWKKRLANMVAGREGLKADELADHHSCRLGKWYDAVTDARYKANPDFAKLIEPHKQVHAHGIQAVRYYNDGNIKEALEEIRHVEAASKDVLSLLAQLESVEKKDETKERKSA